MKYLFSSLIISCSLNMLSAQVTVEEQPVISEIMNRYITINQAITTYPGYRIQIIADTDRSKVEAKKQQFNALFPSMYADWTHERPYYKLRAGAFLTKRECESSLARVRKNFPSSYPAYDPDVTATQILNQLD